MSDDFENVVPFPRGSIERASNEHAANLERLAVRTKRAEQTCSHPRSWVSEGDRVVTCRDCNVALDPIDVLLGLSRRHEYLVNQGRALRNEVHHLADRVERLKRDEKNAKARLRNAEHPHLKEARQALSQAEKAFYEAERTFARLGLREDDSRLYRQLTDAWVRCRRAAERLKPAASSTV